MFKKNKLSYEKIMADIERKKKHNKELIEKLKAETRTYECTGKWIAFNINKNCFSKYIKLSYKVWDETLLSIIIQADFIKDDIFAQINCDTVIYCCVNDLLKKAAIENFECEIDNHYNN